MIRGCDYNCVVTRPSVCNTVVDATTPSSNNENHQELKALLRRHLHVLETMLETHQRTPHTA
jgi:hypothetical protein